MLFLGQRASFTPFCKSKKTTAPYSNSFPMIPLSATRSWAGSPPHRFHRPTVESVRLHARRARDRLVSRAELFLTAVVRPGLDAPTFPPSEATSSSRRCAVMRTVVLLLFSTIIEFLQPHW